MEPLFLSGVADAVMTENPYPVSPLPIVVPQPVPCVQYNQYTCVTKTTSPPTTTCVGPVFVFARHYIGPGGKVLPGAFNSTTNTYGAAYVPAVTACRQNITTVPISKAGKNPNAPYYGL